MLGFPVRFMCVLCGNKMCLRCYQIRLARHYWGNQSTDQFTHTLQCVALVLFYSCHIKPLISDAYRLDFHLIFTPYSSLSFISPPPSLLC